MSNEKMETKLVRAMRLAKSLREIKAGTDQPILNAAANMLEYLVYEMDVVLTTRKP